MKVEIDTTNKSVLIIDDEGRKELPLYSREAFEVISDIWLKVGWDQKYSYTFTWLGRPIIQLPEDLLRLQEVLFQVRPDVIIETGVAHGGSLIFYATLCKALGKGRVIGIDIEIRPPNRKAIEDHFLSSFITLVEGSSTEPQIVQKVQQSLQPGDTVLVILDSCHSKEHVYNELKAYHPLVTPGSYIIATDGIMRDLADVAAGKPEWTWDNPTDAAIQFAQEHPSFKIEQPRWLFNESRLTRNNTYWPAAYLKRLT